LAKVARSFGRRVRSWRGHVCREDVAERAGVTVLVLAKIEHGRACQLPVEDVQKVVEALEESRVILDKKKKEILKLFRVILTLARKREKASSERCCCHSRRNHIRL